MHRTQVAARAAARAEPDPPQGLGEPAVMRMLRAKSVTRSSSRASGRSKPQPSTLVACGPLTANVALQSVWSSALAAGLDAQHAFCTHSNSSLLRQQHQEPPSRRRRRACSASVAGREKEERREGLQAQCPTSRRHHQHRGGGQCIDSVPANPPYARHYLSYEHDRARPLHHYCQPPNTEEVQAGNA
eukprot:5503253-Pyramimonas_sp.AAC.1